MFTKVLRYFARRLAQAKIHFITRFAAHQGYLNNPDGGGAQS
jgi:hypothetical protein